MYYAQITNGVVTAVTETHGTINAPDMVAIASLDASLLGNSYANGVFTPPVIPAPPKILSKVAYLKRFTQAERIAIRSAAKVSPQVNDYIEMLNAAADVVHLEDPITAEGLYALEAAGLLAAGRAAEILT